VRRDVERIFRYRQDALQQIFNHAALVEAGLGTPGGFQIG
jgi:hypothetical protein